MIMKKILCFGDSNVYGFNPLNGSRYDVSTRWSGILSKKLNIIEAGCNNRTAFSDNPAGIKETGYKILPQYIEKYSPDIIIIAVGINDLQTQYNNPLENFKTGLENLMNLCNKQKIILLAPSCIKECILNSFFSEMFDENSINKSQKLTPIYEYIATKYNCDLLDLNKIVSTSNLDGLHYDTQAHAIIAENLKSIINSIIF